MSNASSFERLVTLTTASDHFNIKLWLLRRGAKQKLFPVYRVGNGRMLVRLSEVEAFIQRSRSEVRP